MSHPMKLINKQIKVLCVCVCVVSESYTNTWYSHIYISILYIDSSNVSTWTTSLISPIKINWEKKVPTKLINLCERTSIWLGHFSELYEELTNERRCVHTNNITVLIIERNTSLPSLICCVCCPISNAPNEDATCDVAVKDDGFNVLSVVSFLHRCVRSHSRNSVHIALTSICCLPMRFSLCRMDFATNKFMLNA